MVRRSDNSRGAPHGSPGPTPSCRAGKSNLYETLRQVVTIKISSGTMNSSAAKRTWSFLPIIIIQRLAPQNSPLWRAHTPFLAVRVISGFAHWIIRDHVKNEVLIAIIDDLVRFVRLEQKCIARFNGRRASIVPNQALA